MIPLENLPQFFEWKKATLSLDEANLRYSSDGSPSMLFKETNLLLVIKSSILSQSTKVDGDPEFLVTQFTISSLVLPPVYSTYSPCLKNISFGYEAILYLAAIFFYSVASTLARGVIRDLEASSLAASAKIGAKVLQ